MRRRDPQHGQVPVVRDAPEEVNAFRVDRHFLEHAFAGRFRPWAGAAVADVVAADDDDMGVGAAPADLLDGAHEDVEAAVGLEVAGNVGDDFVLVAQRAAVGQGRGCSREGG